MAFDSSLQNTEVFTKSAGTPFLKSIGTRLFISVLGGALIAVGGLSYLFYTNLKEAAEKEVFSALKAQTDLTEIKLAPLAAHSRNIALAAVAYHLAGVKDPEAYKILSYQFYLNRPQLAMAAGFGQGPNTLVPNVKAFWPYFNSDAISVGQKLPGQKSFYYDLGVDNYLGVAPKNEPLFYYEAGVVNKTIWLEPYVWRGASMFTVSDPLRDPNGKPIGATGIDINATTLTKEIVKNPVYKGVGYFTILSPQGKILAYPPDPQKSVGVKDPKDPKKDPEIPTYAAVPELLEIWDKVKQGKEGALHSQGNLVAYRRLESSNWIYIATVPESVIIIPVLTTTLVGAALTTLLLAFIVLLFVRNLNKRLQPILDECNRIATTDESIQEKLRDTDEIGRLSVSFFNLVEQQTDQLEQKASEARQSEILAEISRVRDTKALEAPLELFLNELRAYLHCDRIFVYSFNADGTGTITAESKVAGLPSAKDEGLSFVTSSEQIEAYRGGQIVVTDDVLTADLDSLEFVQQLQAKSQLTVPIFRAGELNGLIIADHSRRKHQWQEQEITFLQQRALSLGQAFGGLGLLEQKAVAEQERSRTQALQKELINLLGDVEGAAGGDLTVRAQITADEIGIVADFFNSIIESLRDVVTQVKISAGQVNVSVGSNDEAIRQLAEEAIAQTAQITDTLKSVEEMTNSIQQVARNASQAADASQVAASTAEAGGTAMEKTVSSILLLRETVADTAKKVKHLGESSQQISKVVALINQIALKTNLLAVNASIEAARAGEEGRGFAVVAEEVGALAAQSATATREIERIVENIQQETGEVLQAMESSTSQVVEGTKQVEEAKLSLGQILEVSRQVNELFQSISTATSSQVNTSEIVKELMEKISATSQRSSSTSKEVSQSLQETVQITKQLQESVGTFKVS